jgi:carboxymethylenebutenolidase
VANPASAGRTSLAAGDRLKPDAVVGFFRRHPRHRTKPVPTMPFRRQSDIPMTHVNELRALHPGVTIYDYPADHGFHCDERGSYHAAATKQAYARTLEFMARHVG